MEDFKQVLKHWGIGPHELEQVINGLKFERIFYTGIGVIGLIVCIFSNGLILFYEGCVLMALGTVALVCRTWRIRVLERKKFVFFKDWLLGKGA
ncbi:hypothetical protein DSCO28_73270 (plasmid) [Desulfosarcina ovata subsp. sediminis]|uniref:Uncharacterized protein n=1 Tax=Desulfosarcina ovata subsp. sediminis TaxID=885957 RepID=A0A5K8A2U3_9BACT|nr:hypothetical protein [Desulfosarcina ovata]BBO86761.1 hypothetical protein DSCO28_73270 [Desulfosarcina ovata subsp. sediminis]